MGLRWTDWPAEVLAALRRGVVIPAHPLALDAGRRLDPRRQRALTRYYLDAGAGGLAVGVHTTQFAIREVGLYEPVLELAMRDAPTNGPSTPPIMIAGPCRPHRRRRCARRRSRAALGYHAGPALARRHEGRERGRADRACRDDRAGNSAGRVLPAAGGRRHRAAGRRSGAASRRIDNVVAIKIAPFNRYRTLDVVRGVVEAGAADRVTLYTGNDDHIVLDLVTPFTGRGRRARRTPCASRAACSATGACGCKRAVELLDRIHAAIAAGSGSARPARARRAGDRLQRGDLRRRQRFPWRHRRLPRDPAPARAARRHLVPRSARNARSRPGRGDRPRLRQLSASERRRLRPREPLAVALMR